VGFNKRCISLKLSLVALNKGNLKLYYGKANALIFEDDLSEIIHNLYLSGTPEQEILNIINLNLEQKRYEMY